MLVGTPFPLSQKRGEVQITAINADRRKGTTMGSAERMPAIIMIKHAERIR